MSEAISDVKTEDHRVSFKITRALKYLPGFSQFAQDDFLLLCVVMGMYLDVKLPNSHHLGKLIPQRSFKTHFATLAPLLAPEL